MGRLSCRPACLCPGRALAQVRPLAPGTGPQALRLEEESQYQTDARVSLATSGRLPSQPGARPPEGPEAREPWSPRSACCPPPGHGRCPVPPQPSSREDRLCPLEAEDDATAAVRWPEPRRQAGALQGSPPAAWSDYTEEPDRQRQACSIPMWLTDEEAKDGDSSVSSGRLSGSSGGHESCTPPHRTWTERAPQVPRPPRQPRESNPRLEQLRDKIRAQAQRQASCASLGTSTPSSASHLYKAFTPAPRRKARKPSNPLPAPAYPGILSGTESGAEEKATPGQGREASRISQHQVSDSELVGVRAWRKGQALVRVLLGPPPALPRFQSKVPLRDQAPIAELDHSKKVGATESSPVHPQTPSPASVHSDPQMPSANVPTLASRDPPVNIQAAMAVLRDLRQQIQAGLELARARHTSRGLELHDLAGRRRPGPWKPPDFRGSFWKSPGAPTDGLPTSERAGSLPAAQRWSPVAGWESYPHRTWAAPGRDTSFQRRMSPTEGLNSFPQRPWSASARQASCPPKTWAFQGRNLSLQRPGSPPERWVPFLQRSWSASAGQARGPQRAWTACEDPAAPTPRPWSPLERPSQPTWRPWSASFTQGPSPLYQGRGPLRTPSGAKLAWPRPSQGALRNVPEKENEVRPPRPCPQPRGALGPLHGSESLREFMRQKTAAWRRQALEEKASAMHSLELRNQRLQGAHRKQREAMLGRAVPVVSQTTPGIVTFVPHAAQSRDLEAAAGPGAPVLQWSKVTSGMVLGDQEAPGSFCLCLNRALNPTKTLEVGGSQDGWEGAPLLMPASSSLGPLKFQDLSMHCRSPGLCIYLDPEESERLGMPGPLHFRYKQARLQALETMANILKQRIDVLTDKLRRSEAMDALVGPGPGPLPSGSSTPACPRALVPNVGQRAPWDWAELRARPLLSTPGFPDTETVHWSPGWERLQSTSPRARHASEPIGFTDNGRSELDRRLARNVASFQALSPFTGSSLGVPATPDPCSGSRRLEETHSARGAGLVTPWTLRSCGPLSDVRQKSLSFLESLKPDWREQGQALALLRRQGELEVWETQKALGELLSRPRLERLREEHSTQARPGAALEPEQPQVRVDLEPRTSQSAAAARPSSYPLPGRDVAAPSPSPQDGKKSWADGSAHAEPVQEGRPAQPPSQLPPARLWEEPRFQGSRTRPRSAAPVPFSRFTIQMLEQSLREEDLRARHQAALLRLREKALEEKMRAELAWLEHQRGYLNRTGSYAALLALEEKQHQALSHLERELRGIRYLRTLHLSSHRERKLLLQQQQDIVSVQRSAALLQQELQDRAWLPQSSSPEVKARQEEDPETSPQQPEGPAQGSSHAWHTPGSPLGQHPQRSESPPVPHLLREPQDGTPPPAASAVDGHPWPPTLAWDEDTPAVASRPDARGQPPESRGHTGQGDPQTSPILWPVEEKAQALTGSPASSFQGQSRPSLSTGRPHSPQEARCFQQVAEGGGSPPGSEPGLDFAGSSVEGPAAMEAAQSCSGEQRIETCLQENPQAPFSCPEAAPPTVSPGDASTPSRAPTLSEAPSPAAEVAAPPAPHKDGPPARLMALWDLGSEPESTPSACSGASSPRSTAASSGSLASSCPSLQEFQKASAILVQLSESPTSLSDGEAGDTPDTELSWAGELPVPDSWGLHQGRGAETWEGLEGTEALSGHGSGTGVAGLAPAGGLPVAQSLWLRSEQSELSSEVWGQESPQDPGAGARPAPGHCSPTGHESHLEQPGMPLALPPFLGPGEGQEDSGTSGSPTSESDTGKAQRRSWEAAGARLPSQISSSSDFHFTLSFPSGTSASEFGKRGETGPPQASGGCPEGPWGTHPSPSTDGKPLWTSSEPEVLLMPGAPPGNLGGQAAQTADSQAPGHGGRRASPVLEEACTPLADGFLPEILSPVDEGLSYSSFDLPSSTQRDSRLPPLPPILPADGETDPASAHSEDFPTPPEDAVCPGGSLDTPGEAASLIMGEWSSLSGEGLSESPSPGPQEEAGLCLGVVGQGRSLSGELDESGSVGRGQATESCLSEPVSLGSPWCRGAGDTPGRLLVLTPPTLSRSGVACASVGSLAAGDPGLPGSGRGDLALALGAGPHTALPGMERAEVVDLLSAQLSSRILRDTLAMLSEAAPAGSLVTEGPTGTSRVTQAHMAATGRSWGSLEF
ncbi:coiled-coil domain-containing protein 187 isoform X1 [Ovis aries]|uniref:coiled-coil domain-containing protein 187 isoform X1 n=2 Tax=Ovis aries TaxID=9940 RepID=UPI001C2EAEAB|nr:coiled-coil domain-containing protein 187 isoform X1 [Ovis aries]